MMKKPKRAAVTMQETGDAGINPFAVQLLSESFADDPKKFGDETIAIIGRTHDRRPVFILISTELPEIEQFDGWPE